MKLAFLLVIALRLWLSVGQTVAANGDSGYDDRLFLTLARNLLEGGWLGRFNHLTLAKGPFYPIWVAVVFLLGIPLLFSYQLLYAFACMVFTLAVRPLVKRPVVLLIFFTVLLFNPMSYSGQVMDRPFREGIYPALTMLVLGSAAGLLTRRGQGLKKLLPWSVFLGLSLSAFYLTREEGVLIMPSVLLIISFAAVSMLVTRHGGRVRGLLLCVLPFCVWLASIGVVSEVNRRHYGVFTTVELKSPAFLAAYGALTRVKHEKWHPMVPVPRDVRERVYKVSPAFAEIRPFLEGDLGRAWTVNSCLYLSVCDDITGGWFIWLFREAVSAVGRYESAKTAADYYRRISAEVNGACKDGRLECGPERASLSPPWDNRYLRPLLGSFKTGVVSLARFDGFSAASAPTVGPEELLEIFRDMTGGRLSSDGLLGQRLVGWAFSPDSPVYISVHNKEGEIISDGVKFSDSPDVYDHFLKDGKSFPNARKARFFITAHCAGGCYLYIKKGDAIVERTRFENLKSRWTPDLYFTVDYVNNGFAEQTRLRGMKERLLTEIARVYQRAVPVLSILALAAYIAATVLNIKNREVTDFYVISTALIMAIVIRLLILAMIEVSSFPAMYTVYMSSAYPLLLISSALIFIDGERLILRKTESKKV
ncbi:MAG: hypothetical protein HZB22_04545 [Deltaproteobacteria bacterium]|nr:hypothetical protein [Deltaproteobacteria bacterium]